MWILADEELLLPPFQPWLQMIGIFSSFKITVFNSTAVASSAMHSDLKASALELF